MYSPSTAPIPSSISRTRKQSRVRAGDRPIPPALAWLCEALDLAHGGVVVDLGAGLGGPAEWIRLRYPVDVVAIDPTHGSVVGTRRLFPELPTVQAAAEAAPIRSDATLAALALGVVWVAPDPLATLQEAARIAPRVGIIDYCPPRAVSTRPAVAASSGSRRCVTCSRPPAGSTSSTPPCPTFRSRRAGDRRGPADVSRNDSDEEDVAKAIESNELVPQRSWLDAADDRARTTEPALSASARRRRPAPRRPRRHGQHEGRDDSQSHNGGEDRVQVRAQRAVVVHRHTDDDQRQRDCRDRDRRLAPKRDDHEERGSRTRRGSQYPWR